jgi:hypothetical protein
MVSIPGKLFIVFVMKANCFTRVPFLLFGVIGWETSGYTQNGTATLRPDGDIFFEKAEERMNCGHISASGSLGSPVLKYYALLKKENGDGSTSV